MKTDFLMNFTLMSIGLSMIRMVAEVLAKLACWVVKEREIFSFNRVLDIQLEWDEMRKIATSF